MTFADYMRAHPDETIRKVAECLYGGEGGPIDLAGALGQLDAAGAPRAAFLAVEEAWKEFETYPDVEEALSWGRITPAEAHRAREIRVESNQ